MKSTRTIREKKRDKRTPPGLRDPNLAIHLAAPELSEIVAKLALGGKDDIFADGNLEAIHALGHRLFTEGSYPDAATVFTHLCLHDCGNRRSWMGLGSSLQGTGNLEKAIDAYGMAGLCGALDDLEPFYHVALCQLMLKRTEAANRLLKAIARMDEAEGAFRGKVVNLKESFVTNAN
jgi:tetratricopeptide (TPR) repeat protein